MAEEPLSTGNDDPAADLTPKVGQGTAPFARRVVSPQDDLSVAEQLKERRARELAHPENLQPRPHHRRRDRRAAPHKLDARRG